MADKVYYEVEVAVMVPVRVRFNVVVRTEDGSKPLRAVNQWIKSPWNSSFRDGDIEVTKSGTVGSMEDAVDAALGNDPDLKMCSETASVKLVDAK